MDIPEVSEPYQNTVGSFAQIIRQLSGSELSIPSKVADIIIQVLEEDEPPLRLLVGADAVEYAGKAADALATSDEKYRELSVFSA